MRKGYPTWTGLALLSLLVSSAACGGGSEEAATPTPPPQPQVDAEAAARREAEQHRAREAEAERAREAEETRREAEERERPPTYTVEKGDYLWAISARPRIYGDPRFWPLLYDANRDAIADPDLILPGQHLDVPRQMSEAEREGRLFALWRELG